VSRDLTCRRTVELVDGRRLTPVELQWEFLRLAKKYAQDNDGDSSTDGVLERWESALEGLESDPAGMSRQLDWAAKLSLLEAYRERDGLEWNDPKLRLIDLQYHDVRRSHGLYWKLARAGKVERLVDDDSIEWAVDHPPEDTRAYFRGECLRRFSPAIMAASWDALIFDTGDEPLRKVPTLEPMRGTRAHVQSVLDASADAGALIRNLSA
jgi:Pup amidohydrolase